MGENPTVSDIGVSLPWDYISGNLLTSEASVLAELLGPAANGLAFFADHGVSSIELRHRHPKSTTGDMRAAFLQLLDRAFTVTIHGEEPPQAEGDGVSGMCPWMQTLNEIDAGGDREIMITQHPFTGIGEERDLRAKTVGFLPQLLTERLGADSGYRLALENQRLKEIVDPGTSFHGIYGMWEEMANPRIGICWDMGHSFANTVKDKGYPVDPPAEFLDQVVHTHIHDLGPDGRTHWPFRENRVPVERFMGLLKEHGYTGIYNLELSFDRFAQVDDTTVLLSKSIEMLKSLSE